MANYSTLKAAVEAVVKTNGEQAITGANMQTVLLSIINSIGGGGYIFEGVATPSTNAGTPDQNVFYLAGSGTYANFGTSVIVPPTNIAVFKYNGSWTCEQVMVENGGVFDISAFKAVGGTLATYADLAAALGTGGANVPEGVRKGGMSIKFVQTSDNNYVQYRLMSDTFNTTVANWQGVDDEPTAGSENLVKSDGIAKLAENESILGFTAKDTPKRGYINSSDNKWVINPSSNHSYIIIPVAIGNKVKITANSSNGFGWALLKTLGNNGDTADYCSWTGLDSLKWVNQNSTASFIVPNSDGNYLYIYFGQNKQNMPTSIVIDGYDLMDSLLNYIQHINSYFRFMGIANPAVYPGTPKEKVYYLATLEGTYTNFGNLVLNSGLNILKFDGSSWSKEQIYGIDNDYYTGYINASTGKWVTTGANKYKIYKVKSGDVVKIVAPSANGCTIAGLKSYNAVDGGSVDFSESTGWTTTISINQGRELEQSIPSDVNYLFVYNGNNGGFKPEALYINGNAMFEPQEANVSNALGSGEDYYLNGNGKYIHKGYLDKSTNKWKLLNQTSNYLLYPVKSGDVFVIKANSSGGVFAIISSDTFPSNEVNTVYSSDANFSGYKDIAANQVFEGCVPSDGKYLYIAFGNNNAYKPVSVMVDGLSVYDSVQENLEAANKKAISTVENEGLLNAYSCLHYGYIDATNKIFKQSGFNKYAIIKIKAGDFIEVKPTTGVNSPIGILKSYSVPNDGTAVDFSSDEEWNGIVTVQSSVINKIFTAPSDAAYLYVYFGNNEIFKPAYVKINGYNIFKTARENYTGLISDNPIHLRIMQYNVGHFCWGVHNRKMTEEEYQSVIMNYRRMLGTYQPDILTIQEYEEYMDENDQHPTDTSLLKPLLPYDATNLSFERSIWSKFKRIYSLSGIITADTPPPAGEEQQRASYMFSINEIGGKIIKIVTAALSSQDNDYAVTGRRECLAKLIAMVDDADYAFVSLDMNNQGNGSTLTPEAEGVQLYNYAKTLGYEACNNGYFGSIISISENKPLDNILFKINDRIIYNDFKVLADEYENLSSDHYPVYGDFILV